MSDYLVTKVFASDAKTQSKIDQLLAQEGLRRDQHLDYTCAIFDESDRPIATGSAYQNTLRCFAVDKDYQGFGFLNKILSHLIDYQYSRGQYQLFVYTKLCNSKFFADLGFSYIAKVDNKLAFMENSTTNFQAYLDAFGVKKIEGPKIAGLVMNANPFTLGHRALVEAACRDNDHVHLFVVSEDSSLFPYAVRRQLIEAGCQGLDNLSIHETGPYLISAATFPSYFQKDSQEVVQGHTRLDVTIFSQIAQVLGITRRYVGQEPYSQVTESYNQAMKSLLPPMGIEVVEIPRITTQDGQIISASKVRLLIKENKLEDTRDFLPQSTFDFLTSLQAQPIIKAIQASDNVVHH